MKKILLLSTILFSFSACQENDQKSAPAAITQQHQDLSAYEQTKASLDELFLYAEQLKKGEISKEKHAALSYPVGQEFRSQRAALSEADKQKLSVYSNARYDEIYPEEDRIEIVAAPAH